MSNLVVEKISAQTEETQAALRALNNAHAEATSFLTDEAWSDLLDLSFRASCISGTGAFLISLDQDASYDNANFDWFRNRFSRFVYVDRIVVSADHQGKGVARALYSDLFRAAHTAGHDRVVCEINLDPPNSSSDAFHEKMGFTALGTARLAHNGKTVRYLGAIID